MAPVKLLVSHVVSLSPETILLLVREIGRTASRVPWEMKIEGKPSSSPGAEKPGEKAMM
jgi:hypothetical protein